MAVKLQAAWIGALATWGVALTGTAGTVANHRARGGLQGASAVLLHQHHPAPMDHANPRQMPKLAGRFGTIPGLSDHTLGTTAFVPAVALGASLNEKHFTLSRAEKGPDSEFSVEAATFDRLCTDARDAWLALGRSGFERQEAEVGSHVFRRSLYFVRDLPAGAIIGPEDIRRIRPGMGLAPEHMSEVIGKRLKTAVRQGVPAIWPVFDA